MTRSQNIEAAETATLAETEKAVAAMLQGLKAQGVTVEDAMEMVTRAIVDVWPVE